MAKKFFYVCAGLFLLALTYHLGARNAAAQSPASQIVGFTAGPLNSYFYVITQNGDVYYKGSGGAEHPFNPGTTYIGNFWDGATAVTPQTWGQVKDRYRK